MTLASPGVEFREIDASGSARAALASNGSIAIKAKWGPVLERVRVSDETELVQRFSSPDNATAIDFLTAASFLAHSSALDVVRIGNKTDMKNASDTGAVVVLNDDDFENQPNISCSFLGRYPGAVGNSLAVHVCDTAARYETTLQGTWSFNVVTRNRIASYTRFNAGDVLTNAFNVGDFLIVDGARYTVVGIDDSGIEESTLTLDRIYTGAQAPLSVKRRWKFADLFSGAPGSNQIHTVVVDKDGLFTKSAGQVLEQYGFLSTVVGHRSESGAVDYYAEVINKGSSFIRIGGNGLTGVNPLAKVKEIDLVGGVDDQAALGTDEYLFAYDLFKNAEEVDAPLIVGGQSAVTVGDSVLGNYLIQNIAEARKDGMVFVSPALESVVNNRGNEINDVKADRSSLPSSSYAHMDSGWKYMYDKYNDVFRWVPLCGDSAGCYARTDLEADTWFSGAGVNRGGIKNVVKLAWNPTQNERDSLYSADINPIVDFPVQGPILFGDKTLKGGSSVFSRVNVRRLFIFLEKTVAEFARELLFEYNDEVTQARFVAAVEPFLREIQGRRGITKFEVIADSRVNTPSVVANNQFVGQIFVQPAQSINFIRLDFVAVGANVTFETVVGRV